jgi:SAM-dependent methyltransferase
LSPFDLNAFDRVYPTVTLWKDALRESLAKVRVPHAGGARILDAAGGTGWLAGTVAPPHQGVVLDCDELALSAGAAGLRVAGSCEQLPFADQSFDVVVSISAVQYFCFERFLSEAHRVLKPGGILALHENGPRNPVIMPTRALRRLRAMWSPWWRDYLRSVRGYPDLLSHPFEGFEVIRKEAHFVLSPLAWILEAAQLGRAGIAAQKLLLPVDRVLLRAPGIDGLGFLNIVHLRKPGTPPDNNEPNGVEAQSIASERAANGFTPPANADSPSAARAPLTIASGVRRIAGQQTSRTRPSGSLATPTSLH